MPIREQMQKSDSQRQRTDYRPFAEAQGEIVTQRLLLRIQVKMESYQLHEQAGFDSRL